MTIASILIVAALGLYTVAIWSERKTKMLKVWIIIVFTCALFSDFAGTKLMAAYAQGNTLNTHAYIGYTALGIMALHYIFALLAAARIGRFADYFHKGSIYAWFVWLVAFITGIPWNKFFS